MEFTHIMEMAITAAADSTGSVPPVILIRKRSVKAAIAEAREIGTKRTQAGRVALFCPLTSYNG